MNDGGPFACVVVPAYNAEKTIRACVDSLLAQDYGKDRHTIIVVDNGSKDGTARILREFGDSITRVTERTRGPAAARNVGILSGTGDIVAFMDADCVAEPGWLRGLVGALDHRETGMVGGTIRATAGADPVQVFGEKIHDHRRAIEKCKPPYVISMNSAVRRTVLAEVGLFDASFRRGEDVDLSWRIHRAGYRLRYAPDAVVHHANESTLGGLWREGWLHGYWGVKVKREHESWLNTDGRRRNLFGNARRTLINVRRYVGAGGDQNRQEHLYETVFNSGKTAGSFCGSLRFGYFEI